ncbi:MAG: type II toxin-antitoxin system Phd/YefM family antitoxin, partial [Bacilli bacterium]|nr:type II toxin-antitoxin system Phd/YefM family antitoxin [Bacilli bacterium]
MDYIPVVKTTNITSFRNNLREKLEEVVSEKVRLIVTRSNDKNVIIMSENEYNDLIKIINNFNYTKKLQKSVKEIEEGKVVSFTLDELKR